MLLLVPRQVLLPRRRVLTEVALVPPHLAPVNAPHMVFHYDGVRPEVALVAFVELALGSVSDDVPAQVLVPHQVLLLGRGVVAEVAPEECSTVPFRFSI